jgi:hypothetical protein
MDCFVAAAPRNNAETPSPLFSRAAASLHRTGAASVAPIQLDIDDG